MTIRLLKGIEFKATVRPNSIQWSWGRPGLKLVNHSLKDNEEVRQLLDSLVFRIKTVLNSTLPEVNKAKEIKNLKEWFIKDIKPYEIKE